MSIEISVEVGWEHVVEFLKDCSDEEISDILEESGHKQVRLNDDIEEGEKPWTPLPMLKGWDADAHDPA